MGQILCIIDGMTDPGFCPEAFPALATMRRAGSVDTCRGHKPESLGCILRLLGTQTVPEHLRGYAEALGAGLDAGADDLIFRGSWFALDEEGRCTTPIPGPVQLDLDGSARYVHLEQYKSLLFFPGMARLIDGIVTHAPYECAGRKAGTLCPAGCPALEALFHRELGRGRCLLPWGESVPAQLPPFPLPAAVISGTTVVKGIARLRGMELCEVPGATGDTDADLAAKTAAALRCAARLPFVLLHINGADEAGHRKDAAEKTAFLHRVDREVLAPLQGSGHRLTVVADHGTDPATGTHIAAPQPLFVCG